MSWTRVEALEIIFTLLKISNFFRLSAVRTDDAILIQISPLHTFCVSLQKRSSRVILYVSDADILISADPEWAIIKELNSRVGSTASASGRYPLLLLLQQ